MGKVLAFKQKGQNQPVVMTLICEECLIESTTLEIIDDSLLCLECAEAEKRRSRLKLGWDEAEEN